MVIVGLNAVISVPAGATRLTVLEVSLIVPITSGLSAANLNEIMLFSALGSDEGFTSSSFLHDITLKTRRVSNKLIEKLIFFITVDFFYANKRISSILIFVEI